MVPCWWWCEWSCFDMWLYHRCDPMSPWCHPYWAEILARHTRCSLPGYQLGSSTYSPPNTADTVWRLVHAGGCFLQAIQSNCRFVFSHPAEFCTSCHALKLMTRTVRNMLWKHCCSGTWQSPSGAETWKYCRQKARLPYNHRLATQVAGGDPVEPLYLVHMVSLF